MGTEKGGGGGGRRETEGKIGVIKGGKVTCVTRMRLMEIQESNTTILIMQLEKNIKKRRKFVKDEELTNVLFTFLSMFGKCFSAIMSTISSVHTLSSSCTSLSWKSRSASCAQILTKPSTGRVSSGLRAS